MKIRNVVIASLSVVLLASCSGPAELTFCDCIELNLKAFEEVGMTDEAKMKAFQEEHKETLDKCEAIGDKMNEEMKDLSPEEQAKKGEELKADCPAFQKVEEIMMKQQEEMMKQYEESMQNMDAGDLEGLLEEGSEAIEGGLEEVGEAADELIEGLK